MIPELNDREWYQKLVRVDIDRVSLLRLIACLELVLRHLELPDTVKNAGVKMGKAFTSSLIAEGLILPDQVREVWEDTFNMSIKPDRTFLFPELTDSQGRPWK
jgi:hypothetical protein